MQLQRWVRLGFNRKKFIPVRWNWECNCPNLIDESQNMRITLKKIFLGINFMQEYFFIHKIKRRNVSFGNI